MTAVTQENKKHVWRPGDRARVLEPVFVTRVGYPKTVDDYLPQVDEHDADLMEFLRKLLDREVAAEGPALILRSHLTEKMLEHAAVLRVKRQLAYLVAKRDGFGGRERVLHTVRVPEAALEIIEVGKVKRAVTGTYYPPTGWSSLDGDDYEPGGLSSPVHHQLATVDPWMHYWYREELRWIEVTNLEPVS